MGAERVQRVALFGGSFDPPHRGHVAMAEAAVGACGLDRVVFVPCRESPLKGRRPGASGEERVAMLEGVTSGLGWAEVSDWEIGREGPSYSWETVEYFRGRWPRVELWWVMGEDQWAALERWARPEVLREGLRFIVFARLGAEPEPRAGWRMTVVPGEWEVSSTRVREVLATGGDVMGMLMPETERYVRERGLYGARA